MPNGIDWETYYLLIRILLVWNACMIGFAVYWEWYRKRGRILIRIKTALGEKRKWKKPEDDGRTIVMKKAKGRKAGWTFHFSNKALYDIQRFFGLRRSKCLDVIYDAPEAISYDYDAKTADKPVWDKKTSKEWIEAETLRKRAQGMKYPLPSLFWIMLILQFITLILVFLSTGGKIAI